MIRGKIRYRSDQKKECIFFYENSLSKDIVYLDVGYNSLKSFEFKDFNKLKILYINNNLLTFFNFYGLFQLEELYINNNKLTDDTLENVYFDFPNLKKIYMRFNNLVNINLRFDRFINLKELDISNNCLTSFKIKSGVFPNLKELDITSNCLTSFELNFDELPNLKNLNLSHNKIKTISLSCSNLKLLNISCNPIDVLQIKYLPKLTKIFNSCVNFSKSKIISRRRVYLLCESKVGAVEDVCESKNKEVCYRCKKNVNVISKINIRKQKIPSSSLKFTSYYSCC